MRKTQTNLEKLIQNKNIFTKYNVNKKIENEKCNKIKKEKKLKFIFERRRRKCCSNNRKIKNKATLLKIKNKSGKTYSEKKRERYEMRDYFE